MVHQIDNDNYVDENLVEVKVPINMQYFANWKNYERCDGEIEYEGTHYNYVKRKLSNDTLSIASIGFTPKPMYILRYCTYGRC